MGFFMQIELNQIILTTQTNWHSQTLVRCVLFPTARYLQILKGLRPIHFHKGHRIWDRTLKVLEVIERCQGTGDPLLIIICWEMIQTEVRLFQDSFFHNQLACIAVLDIDHCLDVLRQGTHDILYKDERAA